MLISSLAFAFTLSLATALPSPAGDPKCVVFSPSRVVSAACFNGLCTVQTCGDYSKDPVTRAIACAQPELGITEPKSLEVCIQHKCGDKISCDAVAAGKPRPPIAFAAPAADPMCVIFSPSPVVFAACRNGLCTVDTCIDYMKDTTNRAIACAQPELGITAPKSLRACIEQECQDQITCDAVAEGRPRPPIA